MARRFDKVRKRDGRVVPYDEAKIAGAIHAASKSAGVDNRYLAEDLAGVVTLYLERYHDREVPASDEIRRIIEKILAETGHATIARSFGEHRRAKAVAAPARQVAELFPSAPVLVEGLSRGEVSAWDRARIVVALKREARLDEKLAEEVAAAVEQKIFTMGTPRVTTAVVRELVNHELMLRGAKSDVMGQLVVGVPKYDLAQLVAALPDADKLSRRVGEAALQQFALQELFSPSVAEAHLEGRIHVHGIERPAALYWLAPDLDGLRRTGLRAAGPAHLREPARTARDFTAQVAHVAASSKSIVGGGLELAHLNLVYADLVEGDVAREVDYLAGAVWDDGVRVGIDVGTLPPLRRPERALAEKIESLAREGAQAILAALPPGELHVYVSPHAFRNGPDLDILREACRVAEARGRITFIFDRRKPPQNQPWRFGPVEDPADDPSWPAIAQAVTINVAQAAYRGGDRGVDAELERAVDAAVRAHLDKKRFLRRFYTDDDAGLGLELGWAVEGRGLLRPARFRYSVALAGLHEAAAHLGDERSAFRMLSFVFAMLKQAAEANHLRVALDDLDVADAAARFARVDAHLHAAARGAAPYAPGVHLPGRADRVMAESRLHALVGSGVVRLDRGPAADLFSMLVRIHAETLAAQVRIG